MKPLTRIEREKLRVALEDWAYDEGLVSTEDADPDHVAIPEEAVDRLLAVLHEEHLLAVVAE